MSKFKTASAMMQEWEEASKRMGDVRTFGNFDEWIAEHDKEIRNKTIEEFFRRLNLKVIELPLDDFVVRDILGEIRKIAMQMREGAKE